MHYPLGRLAAAILAVCLLALSAVPLGPAAPVPSAPRGGLVGASPSVGTPTPPRGVGINGSFLLLTVTNPGGEPDRHLRTAGRDRQLELRRASSTRTSRTSRRDYAGNLTPIYGWIEANASNASTATVLWLRLYSIPGASSVDIILNCSPKYTFDLSESGFMGESPLLSSTYAKFDNGWRVFNFYDNFSQGSIDPKLWAVNGGWSESFGQGVHIKAVPGFGANISSVVSFGYPSIVDFYGDLYQSASTSAYITEGTGMNACSGCGTAQGVGWDSAYTSNGPTRTPPTGPTRTLAIRCSRTPRRTGCSLR